MSALQDVVTMVLLLIAQAYLEEREATISQQRAITELSTPVLPLKPGLLVVPVIGLLDATRAALLSEHLLEAIARTAARVVVVDVTGLAGMDTAVAAHLARAVQSAALMGARAVLSGLGPSGALVLASLDVELAGLTPAVDLAAGIRRAEAMLAEDSS